MPDSPSDSAARRLFGLDARIDWKVGVVTVVGTLALVVSHYRQLTPWPLADDVVLFFVLPMACILLLFRDNPRDYGFQLGDWRAGLLLTAASIAVMAPVLFLLVRSDAAMREYYGWQTRLLPTYVVVHLFAWEFFFRGWWLFGYARRFGPDAIWLQAVPFALAHLGKPWLETVSTVFGGFVFGWIAYRTRSFLYPFLIHCFVLSFTIVVAASG